MNFANKMNHVSLLFTTTLFTLGAYFKIIATGLKTFHCLMTKKLYAKTFFKRTFLVFYHLQVLINT